jgi:anaphase-promoting complex subunit 5
MEEAPPPTNHILRPHHIDLLAVFLLLFKEYEPKLPSPFTLHVYRVLLNEVSEVAEPKSHQEVLRELSSGPKSEDVEARKMLSKLRGVPGECRTPDSLPILFHNVTGLFLEKNEEEPPILMRRSIFGYFCRRCFISFVKLSFSGVVKLQKDYLAWCAGDARAGYEPVEKDPLTNDSIMFKTHADMKSWAQPEPYAAWEKGQATGDETTATENLRRFFEQHFHESNDSGVRQHALLNLVRMHYLRNEFPAARKLLLEAITVARTSGDRLTLQHCISMLHRLPHGESGRRPVLNEIQPDLNPLEILFDVKKLMTVGNAQPPSASFERIMQAVGLYDHWIDVQLATPVEAEQWGQHAVQAYVWRLMGSWRR